MQSKIYAYFGLGLVSILLSIIVGITQRDTIKITDKICPNNCNLYVTSFPCGVVAINDEAIEVCMPDDICNFSGDSCDAIGELITGAAATFSGALIRAC